MKLLIALLISVFQLISCRPQNSDSETQSLCTDTPKYSCVPKYKCSPLEAFSDGAEFLTLKSGNPGNPLCPAITTSPRNADEAQETVCCYEDRILDGCSDFRNDGYSCVQKDKCETNALGIRFSNVDGALDGLLEGLFVSKAENASCPDIDTVCCNELDVKITIDTNLDACTDFENDGYSCVQKDKCQTNTLGIRNFNQDGALDGLLEGLLAFKAEDASCPDIDMVCCNDLDVKTPGTTNLDVCTDFEKDGYSCVVKNSCASKSGIAQRTTNFDFLLEGVTETSAEEAVCPNKDMVCCHIENQDQKTLDDDFGSNDESTPDTRNLCSLHSDIFYSCVSKEDCLTDTDKTEPRDIIDQLSQYALAEEAECPDIENEVCCYEDDQLNQGGRFDDIFALNLCENHKDIGYRCVPSQKCDFSDDLSGPRDGVGTFLKTENLFDQLGLADYAECPDLENGVCCHDEYVIPDNDCSSYVNEGYTCVKQTECLDAFLSSSDNDLFVDLRSFDDSNPQLATCPPHNDGDQQVCCNRMKPSTDKRPELSVCPKNEGKTCLSLNECADSAILTNSVSSSFLDIRESGLVDLDAKANLCPVDNQVCCTPQQVPQDNKSNRGPTKTCGSKAQYVPRCGQHNIDGSGLLRISNLIEGKEATQFGEWPHACVLYEKTPKGRDFAEFLGGASLIAPGIVVTATHKVIQKSTSSLLVRCGEWNRYLNSEQQRHQDRDVKHISNHPWYSGSRRVKNDISLLHLEEEFNLDTHLDTICLPDLIDNREDNYEKNDCVVMGWGTSAFNDTRPQNILKQVELPIVDNNECQALLRKTSLKSSFILDESFVCAGGKKGADACTGDGGGPLVCPTKNDKDRYVLAGIIAWGIGCGKENVPGAYAAVTDGLCFIDWATKCKHGNLYKQFYDYSSQCGDNWIDEQISELESKRSRAPFNTYLRMAKELKASCRYKYKPQKLTPIEQQSCPSSRNL